MLFIAERPATSWMQLPLRVMSLQSILSMNLLATLTTGYFGLTSSVHSESIFLKKIKNAPNVFKKFENSYFTR